VIEEPFYLPKLGMQMQEAMIVEWLKRPGDTLATGDGLCIIATDKVETELEVDVAGTLLRIQVPEGQTVPVGSVLAVIQTSG
jgi:pyruvate/2-oxoglutarate dehydrogenase complex dihydrolipoamide acyltransferase (E2) component